jgi:hypothetical protein
MVKELGLTINSIDTFVDLCSIWEDELFLVTGSQD